MKFSGQLLRSNLDNRKIEDATPHSRVGAGSRGANATALDKMCLICTPNLNEKMGNENELPRTSPGIFVCRVS
eukprot:m.45620 g.45620  ORF g.45620 m.45620 type:complete len:73 (-) comp8662_c1_seq1:1201-1419(-)